MESSRTKSRIKGNRCLIALTSLIILIATACHPRAHNGESLQSGGLGLSRTEWERAHGPAASQDSGYVNYTDEQGRFIINFMKRGAGYIKRAYSDPAGVTLDAARSESQTLIPNDYRLIRTYDTSAGPVDLYFSDSLKSIFPDDDYPARGQLGQFIVLYFSDNGIVGSFAIGLGDNP
jgi:hypothetical protein